MITEVVPQQVLHTAITTLGLSTPVTEALDDSFLAAQLRRAAGILCPCPRATLVTAVTNSLAGLVAKDDGLADRLVSLIDHLTVVGDLLELSQVTIDNPNAKATWAFPAPPRFVKRRSGSIFILGITPDEATPLPLPLSRRVVHEGLVRTIIPEGSEDLRETLSALGLREVPETNWLRSPKPQKAADYLRDMTERLKQSAPSGDIEGLLVLDVGPRVNRYNERWISASRQSGQYIARRPQMYGAPLWGFVDLAEGRPRYLLDFPIKGFRWRGCDAAWHLQMAIDYTRGFPQLYRTRPAPGGAVLDFFSPLPQWAERRLALLGRPAPREKCLFSYWMPGSELEAEEAFLKERLWLTRLNSDAG
ncbi:MAG: hypothetical protein JNL04_07655 [Rhodospirillaceae bacterium]|nr:hypothetical protein [Rhodospirillaceae bacterium]